MCVYNRMTCAHLSVTTLVCVGNHLKCAQNLKQAPNHSFEENKNSLRYTVGIKGKKNSETI